LKQIIKGSPATVFTPDQLTKVADNLISSRRMTVTGLSAAAGLPGGFGMLASIPADTAQYLYHSIILSQQLAYLYGFPELTEAKGNDRETLMQSITVFVGVMFGVSKANEFLNAMARQLAEQAARKLLEKPLATTAWYPVVKAIAKTLGIRLTSGKMTEFLKKGIPLVGAAISGGITYYTFKKGADRLKIKLLENVDTLKIDNTTAM